MEQTKPWYTSRTVWAGLVVILSSVLSAATGAPLPAADQISMVDYIFEIVAAAGGIIAIWGRAVARKRIQ